MNKTTIGVALLAGLAGGVISRYISPARFLPSRRKLPSWNFGPSASLCGIHSAPLWLPLQSIRLASTRLLRTRLPFDYSIFERKRDLERGWESDAKAGSE